MDKEIRYKELLERWFNESESREDVHMLYKRLKDEGKLQELIDELEHQYNELSNQDHANNKASQIAQTIIAIYPPEKEATGRSVSAQAFFLFRWGWVAASIILILSLGTYFWLVSGKEENSIDPLTMSKEIVPGKNGAILMLANGSHVVLDSINNGLIVNQNGAQLKLNNNQLAYNPSGKIVDEVVFNTIVVPKGRQFAVILPDGTKVWLNSVSSLRFPTAFTGTERKVELSGEAYFEVVKNAKMPFRLNVNNRAEIEVLGTHFNVNAYENERMLAATLLEGSIHIHKITERTALHPSLPGVILKPGQQALVAGNQSAQPNVTVLSDVDLSKIMAWKNGLFNFQNATIEDVMKQLERWYDITVKYEGPVPEREFQGKLPKELKFSQVLKILDEMDIKVKLENRVLIVGRK